MTGKMWVVLAGSVMACRAADPQGPATRSPTPAALSDSVKVETVASGLDHPWGLSLMPDGRMLVTERAGRLRIVERDGKLSDPLTGVPTALASGQGGLLDVELDPAFATNKNIYLSYSESGPDGNAGTAVARARLTANGLDSVRVIYRQVPKVRGGNHFGSRLVFAKDGTLFITQGDRFAYREQAQDLASGIGKVIRINSDGSIPVDNPYVGKPPARPEIWSYGHRNIQAAALDPASGQLWTVEHGAAGGDELNHPEAGKNYGWPVITYGRDYDGQKIGVGAAREGMEQPVYYWDPVIAPSGMAFYTGTAFANWKGSILVGGLGATALVRLEMKDGAVVREVRYLGELHERIRDVQVAPDGTIYVVTDNTMGRVLRLSPKP